MDIIKKQLLFSNEGMASPIPNPPYTEHLFASVEKQELQNI